jgi:GH15 family glucan-1,4-alpha-glucosidase
MTATQPYPPISNYAFLSDCRSTALVSRACSVDWCCFPRIDAASCFGRLLDWDRGGHCSIAPRRPAEIRRRYLEGTLVLESTLRTSAGDVRITDCLAFDPQGGPDGLGHLLRIVDGLRGRVDLRLEIEPRFDYGQVRHWLRREGADLHSAIGGNDALLIWSDAQLRASQHELAGSVAVRAGERVRLSLRFLRPHELDADRKAPRPDDLDSLLEGTVETWRAWVASDGGRGDGMPSALRSAVVLKGLTNHDSGAIAAAASTSLPESLGGDRNWDYRYSWVRDSTLAVRALAELGFEAEADAFRRFVQRSAAGHVDDLQIAYGVEGERRLTESELGHLRGYRNSRPVRVGNAAAAQTQHDTLGELMLLAWRWHRRGHSPDDDLWRFLRELVGSAATVWPRTDRGIWEVRGRPRHFVHSKAMCWAALDRGIALADDCMRRAPVRRWKQARDRLRSEIERRGYDRRRGVFVRAFDSRRMDSALLLLPHTGLVEYDDDRMVRTVDAVRDELEVGGLLRRYTARDGLDAGEGAFLPCTFWLAECLAMQGRHDEARDVFDRAAATANDLGLFSEEYDPVHGEMLGNFPQALTHLSHIAAAVALGGGAISEQAVSVGA